ncbi:hypothetical protein [Alkalicoccus chagannorensis]|uniref:hypothetical protein n=1 Tax=Alkalicoccus chagannorensis TaxID=427072 RepID=UPI00047B7F11|nr:hypothetical protein [Alkalicoccus chagannorensis]
MKANLLNTNPVVDTILLLTIAAVPLVVAVALLFRAGTIFTALRGAGKEPSPRVILLVRAFSVLVIGWVLYHVVSFLVQH